MLQQCSETFHLNNDCDLVKYTLAGNRFLWVSSIYINRKSKRDLLDLMAEVQRIVPESDWPYLLLGGDWNISLYEDKDPAREALFTLCKSMGLHIHSCGASRKEKTLDFFVAGSQIVVKDSGCDLSDHSLIWLDIEISAPKVSLKKCTVPNRNLADKVTAICIHKCQNSSDFLTILRNKMRKKRHLLNKVVRRRPRNRTLMDKILKLDLDDNDDAVTKCIRDYWEEKSIECETMFQTNRLKEAFLFLKRVYKFHEYNRRDGSIIDKVKKEDGSVAHSEGEVHKLIIQNLRDSNS